MSSVTKPIILDETGQDIVSVLEDIRDNMTPSDLIKVVSYTYIYSINANASLNLSKSDFGITEPTGYTPLAIYRFNSGNEMVYARNVNIDPAATTVMSVYNTSSANRTNITAYMAIAYIKSDFVAVSS